MEKKRNFGLALNRKKSYPNTYGIVDSREEIEKIEEMISIYGEFDLQAFRQWNDDNIIIKKVIE